MNKVNGVPVLVIRQPPSSCVKSLFCSNCSGDFLFVTGKEDPKPKILLKPPPLLAPTWGSQDPEGPHPSASS